MFRAVWQCVYIHIPCEKQKHKRWWTHMIPRSPTIILRVTAKCSPIFLFPYHMFHIISRVSASRWRIFTILFPLLTFSRNISRVSASRWRIFTMPMEGIGRKLCHSACRADETRIYPQERATNCRNSNFARRNSKIKTTKLEFRISKFEFRASKFKFHASKFIFRRLFRACAGVRTRARATSGNWCMRHDIYVWPLGTDLAPRIGQRRHTHTYA